MVVEGKYRYMLRKEVIPPELLPFASDAGAISFASICGIVTCISMQRMHSHVLDRDRSIFVDARDMETGEVLSNRKYPGARNYERINSFVAKNVSYPPMFICIETNDLICAAATGRVLSESGFLGLSVKPLDENYVYDPMGDFLAPWPR